MLGRLEGVNYTQNTATSFLFYLRVQSGGITPRRRVFLPKKIVSKRQGFPLGKSYFQDIFYRLVQQLLLEQIMSLREITSPW